MKKWENKNLLITNNFKLRMQYFETHWCLKLVVKLQISIMYSAIKLYFRVVNVSTYYIQNCITLTVSYILCLVYSNLQLPTMTQIPLPHSEVTLVLLIISFSLWENHWDTPENFSFSLKLGYICFLVSYMVTKSVKPLLKQ